MPPSENDWAAWVVIAAAEKNAAAMILVKFIKDSYWGT
jgi:hypothetical protein